MKLKTIKEEKVETWLPVFSGFYGTIWETDHDEESELEHINESRAEKGLPAVEWDAVEWDYKGYTKAVAEGVTRYVGGTLQALGMVSGYEMQKLNSPREYNFANDSIDVAFSLTEANKTTIARYLAENVDAFKGYLAGQYTPRSGFIPSYSTEVSEWTDNLEETLSHAHKLGSVFDFVLRNEEGEDFEMDIHEHLSGNGLTLSASNYDTLIDN